MPRKPARKKVVRPKKTLRDHEFVLVDANGWEGLYVDGECVEQYHNVDLVDWLKSYGLNIRSASAYNDPQVTTEGTLPTKLRDVKLD